MLEGHIYDHLAYAFDTESSEGAKYVPLLERRPSIRHGLPKIIVNQHASLVFGEEHFPHVRCKKSDGTDQTDEQKRTEEACTALIRDLKLQAIMQEALKKGSIGSAALLVKIRDNGRPYIEVVSGKDAKPEITGNIDYENLPGLNRIWSVQGEVLRDFGYEIKREDLDKTFWLRIFIDATDWTYYYPLTDEEYRKLGEPNDQNVIIAWHEDEDRSGIHGFAEVPAVWLRNLTVGSDSIDGICTYEGDVADDVIGIDYLLSQSMRGLRYSMDPLLVINLGEMGEAALALAATTSTNGQRGIQKTKGILSLQGKDARAELLEITGKGFDAAQEFWKKLREAVLERCGGIMSGQETKEGPQSGRAIELHQTIAKFYAEQLRVCYGDAGLLPLLNLLLRSLAAGHIDLGDGEDWSDIDLNTPISLTWPQMRLPTGADLFAEIQALELAAGGSVKAPVALLAPNLVSALIAQKLDLDDPASVASEAEKHRNELEVKQQAQEQAQADQAHAHAMEVAAAKPAPAAAGKGGSR